LEDGLRAGLPAQVATLVGALAETVRRSGTQA
jgi:hypothetical protein